MASPYISKSKYIAGIQCPKLLWHYYNDKEAFPPTPPELQAIFDQGHVVGELAKKVFPEGIDVKWDQGIQEVIDESLQLLERRKPLFEAGFTSSGTYARVDVLNPQLLH